MRPGRHSGARQRTLSRTSSAPSVSRVAPNCGQRNPGAVLRFALPYLLLIAAFFAGGVIAGYLPTWLDLNMHERDRDICKWLCPLLLGGTALLIVPITLGSKCHGIDRRIHWKIRD